MSKLISVGFGIEGGLPANSATKDVFGGGGGVTARAALHLGPGFVTLTTGGIVFIPKNLQETNAVKTAVQIPIKAGYKYVLVGHLFVMGEFGYSVFKSYYEDQNNNVYSTSTGGFTFAPSVGVQWGATEVALRYESVQLSGGNFTYMGLRLGFNF